MTEAEAYAAFCKMRWPETEGAPVCPRCGSRSYYDIRRSDGFHRYGCANPVCRNQFSATTGTILHSRKATFRQIMEGFALMRSSPTMPKLRFGRRLGLNDRAGCYFHARLKTFLAEIGDARPVA